MLKTKMTQRKKKPMKTHNFTLMLYVPGFSDELSDALFKAGCDDATLYEVGGAVFLEFDRESKTYDDAVVSALKDVREGADVSVRRIVTNDIVNAAQIAERLGRSRESIRLLINGERGPGGFPAPIHTVGKRPLWGWGEVVDWFERNRIEIPETERTTAFVEALNNALSLLHQEAKLSEANLSGIREILLESKTLLRKARTTTSKAGKSRKASRPARARAPRRKGARQKR